MNQLIIPNKIQLCAEVCIKRQTKDGTIANLRARQIANAAADPPVLARDADYCVPAPGFLYTMIKDIEVDLSYPRDYEVMATEKFGRIRDSIRKLIV